MASLFQACKSAVRNKEGGTFNIGGYDIDIEMYSQQDIDDDYEHEDVAFGDSDESKIVLVAGATITVPAGYTLTPDSPKKSLVIFCNELVNNGTISMYQKAPNTLPHDYYIIEGNIINSNKNIIISAYANNRVTASNDGDHWNGVNGNNGTNRNCGSGGTGSGWRRVDAPSTTYSGSGYAFGGGAGASGILWTSQGQIGPISVNSTYPMRGASVNNVENVHYSNCAQGGVGNPIGTGIALGVSQNFGCGGRVIIFCCNFTNNGTITVNGTDTKLTTTNINEISCGWGGASGAGAIDLFYSNKITEGTMTANGGNNFTKNHTPGKGGNGSITLTQWNLDKVIKEERKMFTKNNWIYLFNNYSQRLREDVI